MINIAKANFNIHSFLSLNHRGFKGPAQLFYPVPGRRWPVE